MNKKKCLAIIPARGGSKRIPNKNIMDFFGKPIISYSIETAIKSDLFDEIMVSTDSEKIADISKKYGAQIPFLRSYQTSDDFIGIADVVLEVINNYKKIGQSFDYISCIFATAPLISIGKLQEAYEFITNNKNYNSVFTIQKFSYPIQRALKIENDFVKMIYPENLQARSQDLQEAYHDAGQFYFIKTKILEDEKTFFAKKSAYIILSETEAQDLDNFDDLEMLKLKYKLKEKAKDETI